MKILKGKSVYGGIAIAPIKVFKKNERFVRRYRVPDIQKELDRLSVATKRLDANLASLQNKAGVKVGRANAGLFEAYQTLLADDGYIGVIINMIKLEHVNAEFAVMETGRSLSEMFENMDDEYMQARGSDVLDLSEMLLKILAGEPDENYRLEEPAILIADEITAAETILLDQSKILGIAATRGSIHSHAAIFARELGIPALVCIPAESGSSVFGDGEMAILDGYAGTLCLSPDEETLDKGWKKLEEEKLGEEELVELAAQESITADGRRIMICANAASLTDVDRILHYGADGIGLFRSEFLYLDSRTFPDEEKQYEIYKTAIEKMQGKKVVIRTMDIGADRQPGYFESYREKNPELGFRAIRLSLKRPDIFKTQLRAIFRAAIHGNAAIMYPLISSELELERISVLVKEAEDELKKEGRDYRIPEQGIMIETPAAVILSDVFARKADFFSIGTNDLTQYTLALDRQNGLLDEFYSAKSPAILRMIEMTVRAAHSEGIRCEVCGELAADESMTEWFIKTGVDALSVAPAFVPGIRKWVRNLGKSRYE